VQLTDSAYVLDPTQETNHKKKWQANNEFEKEIKSWMSPQKKTAPMSIPACRVYERWACPPDCQPGHDFEVGDSERLR
jgi:hypothetical protein